MTQNQFGMTHNINIKDELVFYSRLSYTTTGGFSWLNSAQNSWAPKYHTIQYLMYCWYSSITTTLRNSPAVEGEVYTIRTILHKPSLWWSLAPSRFTIVKRPSIKLTISKKYASNTKGNTVQSVSSQWKLQNVKLL